jgi:alkylation response protein AidB-like acyl-CoA dehydrogenase
MEGSMPDHDSHSALLEVAHAFRPRIIAERDHIEAARRIPEDIAQDLAGAGFFRIFLPEVYGGLDLTPVQAMEVFEELARADASGAARIKRVRPSPDVEEIDRLDSAGNGMRSRQPNICPCL